MSYTPMMKQYLQIKKQYQDCILFFRLGDFYEMFFDDAPLAAQILDIALTARDGGGGKKVPMCGIPHHAATTYIARLIAQGHRVAICEQTEDPQQTKGLVKREVVRVITPGTVMEGACLEDSNHNYLVSIYIEHNNCGLVNVDFSTGLFAITELGGTNMVDQLLSELARLKPAEIILTRDNLAAIKHVLAYFNPISTVVPDEYYQYSSALEIMRHIFGSQWQKNNQPEYVNGIKAAGAMLNYLNQTQKSNLKHINEPVFYSTRQYLQLDAATRRNLELTSSLQSATRWGTLIWVLDHTDTALGSRLLKAWLEQPLVDVGLINWRQNAVEELLLNVMLRQQIKKYLQQVYDLERLAARIAYGTANAKDLVALRNSIDVLPALKNMLKACKSTALLEINEALDDLQDINITLHQALMDDPPVSVRDGGFIKDGYHQEVDRLRQASGDAKGWLAKIEAQEKTKTGIKSLKVGFNKVFGYYIEVTKNNLSQVPEHYIRRQTLVNAERFITPEIKEYEQLILGAEDRLVQLEYQIFQAIRQLLVENIIRLQNTARRVATLDVLTALAEVAQQANYVRPTINHGHSIVISEGRHPVLEKVLGSGEFVPNDTLLADKEIMLITGPNMAGKSTYMRQVALITLMAQTGSFVPAQSATIGVVDKIFTRIGAADDLAGGRSTFMVEMSECKNIVTNATAHSLIIMDEVGRGTSTYDGMSLAKAILYYIHQQIGAKTLFSTHYHELTELSHLPGIHNYTIKVEEKDNQIIFIRKVLAGKADKSYGIQVARLAELPEVILQQAQTFLKELEYKSSKSDAAPKQEMEGKQGENSSVQEPAGHHLYHKLAEKIMQLDIKQLTPLAALNLIADWQAQIQNNNSN